jgi:two-component system sensor histidine kinase HydH
VKSTSVKLEAVSRYAWLLPVLALAGILVLSALLTLDGLRQMQAVYLRSRVADIVARMQAGPEQVERIDEPGLVEIRVFESGEGAPAPAAAILSGHELFRTEQIERGGERIYRAWAPFYAGEQVEVARIDLSASAADFLLVHARHNLAIAALAGLALLALSGYAVWSARRRAALAHLAQLGTLSAVLAHEIRNPLGTIKGFVQLAGEKAAEDTAALLAPALEEIRRLERLVNDLLLYGRPPSPQLRAIEWAPLAGELETHARQAIGEQPVELEIERGAWRFRTDPALLKQALLNLLRNAVEATAGMPGAAVRVRVQPHGARGVAIAVEDNGVGLPASAPARLFEPFYTTKSFGSGLGLAITRRLAESMGGRLALTGATPRGARAELSFPHAALEHSNGNHPHSR